MALIFLVLLLSCKWGGGYLIPPVIDSPEENGIYECTEKIKFLWFSIKKAEEYNLQIKEDIQVDRIILDTIIQDTLLFYRLCAGKYKVRIRSKSNLWSDWSKWIHFEVMPVLIDSFIPVSDMEIKRDYGYAILTNRNFAVISLKNPLSPQLISEISLNSDNPYDIAVKGNYAYVTCFRDGLKIVDISNPANPRLICTFTIPCPNPEYNEPLRYLTVYKDYVYCTTWYGTKSLFTINVANPYSPYVTDSKNLDYMWAGGPLLIVNSLYVGHNCGEERYGYIYVFDISEPSSPKEEAYWFSTGCYAYHDLAYDSVTSYFLSANDKSVQYFEINGFHLGSFPTDEAYWIEVHYPFFFFADSSYQSVGIYRFIDKDEWPAIYKVYSFKNMGHVLDAKFYKNTLYVMSEDALYIIAIGPQ